MVLVQEGDCAQGLVPPCPQICGDLSATSSCQSPCQDGERQGGHSAGWGLGAGVGTPALMLCCWAGCRCPPGLFLQESTCVNASHCHCHQGQQRWLPGQVFLRDGCSRW